MGPNFQILRWTERDVYIQTGEEYFIPETLQRSPSRPTHIGVYAGKFSWYFCADPSVGDYKGVSKTAKRFYKIPDTANKATKATSVFFPSFRAKNRRNGKEYVYGQAEFLYTKNSRDSQLSKA